MNRPVQSDPSASEQAHPPNVIANSGIPRRRPRNPVPHIGQPGPRRTLFFLRHLRDTVTRHEWLLQPRVNDLAWPIQGWVGAVQRIAAVDCEVAGLCDQLDGRQVEARWLHDDRNWTGVLRCQQRAGVSA